MTPDQHRRAAEKRLSDACHFSGGHPIDPKDGRPLSDAEHGNRIAAAQVHATLAGTEVVADGDLLVAICARFDHDGIDRAAQAQVLRNEIVGALGGAYGSKLRALSDTLREIADALHPTVPYVHTPEQYERWKAGLPARIAILHPDWPKHRRDAERELLLKMHPGPSL